VLTKQPRSASDKLIVQCYRALSDFDNMSYATAHSAIVETSPPGPALCGLEYRCSEADFDPVESQAQGLIQVDPDEFTFEFAYDTDGDESPQSSVYSSLLEHTFENGRRYHKYREGRYAFPNDEAELDREDVKHSMMLQLCQKLHYAPLDNPQQILDIGTGTGIWAVDGMFHNFDSKLFGMRLI
jgi:hypothetical protein